MPIIDDIIRNLRLAIDSFWYQLLMTLAAFQWSLLRGAFMMGYAIQLLTEWLSTQAFSPLITQTGESLQLVTSLAFVIALFVLGITYLLASIVRLDVISPRNAILWYIAGALFFQFGPVFYRGMEDFLRTVSAAFYTSVLAATSATTGGALASLSGVQTTELGILTPCDNFGPYLGRPGGHGATVLINGLDVGLAYLRADGIDVMGYPYPTSDSCQAHFPPQSFQLPWEWYRPGSFFDNTQSPPFFADMTDEQRAASLGMASAAQWRLFSAWPLVWFGIFEQILALCLTIAQGLTFVSFACAILFGFFRRTESVAWAVVDQWLELIVQTVALAMLQALVVGFFLAGTATNNGLVVLGIGLLCTVLECLLLWSGLKAIWRAFNRLFDAVGRVTGGAILPMGVAARTAVSTAGAVATNGMSLVGNTLGGASALMSGASWAQAAGVAFGGSQMLTGVARTLTRLPGLRDTELAEAADHFVEGAVTRQVARGVPMVGRVTGPVVGATLLSDRNPTNAYEDEAGRPHQPMLVPAVGRTLAGLTRGPRWTGEEAPVEGEFTPVSPQRMGTFTPVAALSDAPASAAQVETAAERSNYIEQETDEELEQHITDVARSAGPIAGRGTADTETATSKLEHAADRLSQAADGLARSTEGRLQVAGSSNVASVMGDTVALLAARGVTSPDNFAVANAMTGALGVTPVADGKPPIENDLARFGLFTHQALTMGLTPAQAERVVREVKDSPEGKFTSSMRDELIQHEQATRGMSWQDANREADTLEHAARVLPNDISAYGLVNMPTPNIQIAPEISVRPEVEITVDTNKGDVSSEGPKRDTALMGSAEMLGTSAPSQGGEG